MRWLLILVCLYSGMMQAKIKPYSSNTKRWLASLMVSSVVSTGVFQGTTPGQEAEPPPIEQKKPPPVDWRKVDSRSPVHQQSVFYLLIDLFDNWRVMPITYLGDDRDGDPLFIGARMQIVRNGRKVFRFSVTSLVSHRGLVRENIDPQEVAIFEHPDDHYFDLSVLKIEDVKLDEYQAITVAPYPDLGQELEMVAYRLDLAEDLLHFFSYPSYVRDCRSNGQLIDKADRQVVVHGCNVYHTPAVRGTAIFTRGEEEAKLVALHFGSHRDQLSYAIEIPQQLNKLLALPVDAHGKMTLTWGEVKRLAVEGN